MRRGPIFNMTCLCPRLGYGDNPEAQSGLYLEPGDGARVRLRPADFGYLNGLKKTVAGFLYLKP